MHKARRVFNTDIDAGGNVPDKLPVSVERSVVSISDIGIALSLGDSPPVDVGQDTPVRRLRCRRAPAFASAGGEGRTGRVVG